MEIRRAYPEEAAQLKQIILAAKGYWGYPADWLAQWGSLLTFSPDFIHANEVYVAIDNATVVGFYALIKHGCICELDHLWIVPERIRTGIGSLLFAHALKRAATLGAEQMEWEADAHAVGFYQRMGGRHLRDTNTMLEGILPIMGIDIDPSMKG